MAFERSKEIARSFKRELIVYQRVLRDARTPTLAKFFLGLAIGYLCMPLDLIPDFIPVIGHLDDAIIVPVLVFAALRSAPSQIVSEHREQVIRECAASTGKDQTIPLPSKRLGQAGGVKGGTTCLRRRTP
jgi:uncharacterized membrane protein YkvA (DUF1232 family)